MSYEETAMVDYARLYDMSHVEIGLFFRKNEDELINMIEDEFTKEIRRLRSALTDIRKRKTEIKTLKQSLENPVEYFENLIDSIYTGSESNIKSLKVTTKKVKSLLRGLKGISTKQKEKSDPITRVIKDQILFLESRLEYYEKALEKYQNYIEFSRTNRKLAKKDKEKFKEEAEKYCSNLLESIEIEDVAIRKDEQQYREELNQWRESLAVFQEEYEETIIKSLE